MKRTTAILLIFCILFSSSVVVSLQGNNDSGPDTYTGRGTRAGPTAVATFHSLGLYWSPGDGSSTNTCNVKYRENQTVQWSDGYPLWFDPRISEYKGSLVELEPGMNYEIELELQTTLTKVNFYASTWNETFPIAQVVIVQNMTTTLSITQSGTKDGYILYTHEKGKSATIDVANAQDHCIYVDASYVIIRDLVIKDAKIHGIYIEEGNNDIVIERCDISGWGRIDGSGWGEDLDSAIFAGKWSAFDPIERIIVQRNTIHHPRSDSNNWNEDHPNPPWNPYHPQGPQAISFINTDGNHVLRYNHVYSDEDHYFNDIFGAGSNYGYKGFPNCDSDIYGNRLENCWDDGIESEGANRNVRIWGNFINNTMVKIACTATEKGPLYIWRNVCDRARRNHTLSDDSHGNFMKVASKEVDGEYWGDGKIYIFHNTLLQAPPEGGLTYPMGCSGGIVDSESSPWTMTEVVSRNNILQVHKPWWSSIWENPANETNSFDYDLYNGDHNYSATPPAGIEDNGIKGTPTYDPGNGQWEYYLGVGSNGHNDGTPLNNFNDNWEGNAPDIGAHERGAPPMEFGPDAYLQPLTITTTDVPSVWEDQPYSVDYDAVGDPMSTYLDWNLGTNATFLSINRDTGILQGTPVEADVGTYWVTVDVHDDYTQSDSTNFNLEVINNDPPVTTITVGEPKYGTDPVYANSSTEFNLTSTDADNSVNYIWHNLVGGSVSGAYTGNFTLAVGTTHILYGAIDILGEAETEKRLNVSLDDEPPVISLNIGVPKSGTDPVIIDNTTSFNMTAADAGCGLATIWMKIGNNSWKEFDGNFSFGVPGNYTVSYYSVDRLGNFEVVQTLDLTFPVPEPLGSRLSGKITYTGGPLDGENATGTLVYLNAFNGTDRVEIQNTTLGIVTGDYEFLEVPKLTNCTLEIVPTESNRYIPDERSGYVEMETDPFVVKEDLVIDIELHWQELTIPPQPLLSGIVTFKGGPKDGQVAVDAIVAISNIDYSPSPLIIGKDGTYRLMVPVGVNYTITIVPSPGDRGYEEDGVSGYMQQTRNFDISQDLVLDHELNYYIFHDTPAPEPTITITEPLDGWIFEPQEKIAVYGISTDLPEGGTITAMIDGETWTGVIQTDGTWLVELTCPDDPGTYQIIVESGMAADDVFIEVQDTSAGDDLFYTSLCILGSIFLIIIIVVVIVIVIMAKKSKVPKDLEPFTSPSEPSQEEELSELNIVPMGAPPDQSGMYHDVEEQLTDEEAFGAQTDEFGQDYRDEPEMDEFEDEQTGYEGVDEDSFDPAEEGSDEEYKEEYEEDYEENDPFQDPPEL